uniref:Allophycocyanin beta 18 subunit n=1 Tax=Spyridia filamentosa TaxID=196632 RepID=A0A1Z1MJD5_SPYFI|nr:allophycocyanin beta 18 subunit [Spyridia filamentosa]ARW66168.1 allophycocyanin beta 18 subunit [Spyridia filamentosa]
MQDAITSILNKYDLAGQYLDTIAINEIGHYFSSVSDRIRIIEIINSESKKIIQEAAAQLYAEQEELLRPGGNSYTTRRYSACLRDIEYYLRYATYALIANSTNILNERLLDGLKDTYNSLGVPIGPTVRSMQILQDIIIEKAGKEENIKKIINEPFSHMINILSEKNI